MTTKILSIGLILFVSSFAVDDPSYQLKNIPFEFNSSELDGDQIKD